MSIDQPLEALNERELEIIPLLAEGLTNKEIANRLFLAPNTVKWYIRQLNSKLDTSSRDEIVVCAEALGLMDAPKEETHYLRPRTNLPHQTTPFIGRDAELDEIHRIIEKPDVRLLTILAPGGMGKTRIALEATEQQINHFPDGVYFVPLQPLNDIANIVPQIATAIGFQFGTDGAPQKQQLLNFLSERKLLLLIDNWEHLLEGALLVNEILSAAPDVKIIATSREKLNLLGESVYVLQGMQFPDWETPEDALEYDSVQLLVQSAQRVKTNWQVTEENLIYVARICRLTQGMPLGILLATSWLDVYSLERISEEIQKNADILESDMRDIPERQRSIHAVFEYSWQKLKPQEQDCLMKMSVFRGGCTPTAAETITGANARVFQGLVNKALLMRNQQGFYDIHELLRQYSEQYLDQSEDADEVRDAHMEYYAKAVQEREAHLKGGRQVAAVQAITGDFENVRAAWLRAVEHYRFDLIEGMYFCLRIYTNFRKRYEEVAGLFALASDALEQKPNMALLRANLQSECGFIHIHLNQFEIARQLLSDIHDFMREHADTRSLAYYLMNYAHSIRYESKDPKVTSPLFNESLSLFENIGDQWGWIQVSAPAMQPIRTKEEREVLQRAYQLAKDVDDKASMAYLGGILVLVALDTGNWDQATTYLSTGVDIVRELDEPRRAVFTLTFAGELEFAQGNVDRAEQLIKEALQFSRDTFDMHARLIVNRVMAWLAIHNGNIEDAYQYAVTAQRYGMQGTSRLPSSINGTLALILLLLNRYQEARDTLKQIVPLFFIVFPPGAYEVAVSYALLVANEGRYEYATELLGRVLGVSWRTMWIERQPFMIELQKQLETHLGTDAYHAALERGKVMELQDITHKILAELHADET